LAILGDEIETFGDFIRDRFWRFYTRWILTILYEIDFDDFIRDRNFLRFYTRWILTILYEIDSDDVFYSIRANGDSFGIKWQFFWHKIFLCIYEIIYRQP